MHNPDCIFCKIVSGDSPAHKIWSDETHLAFLSIFPNTDGFTVVIPKMHIGSYAFEQSDEVLSNLIIATKKVARIIDNYYSDVARCGMFFEGYGVNHLHSKLFPMHGTEGVKEWENIESENNNQFFPIYPGYLSSNNSKRANDSVLAELASSIRASYQDSNNQV